MEKTKDAFMQLREQGEATIDNNIPTTLSPSAQVNNGLNALKQMDAASIDTLAKALIHEVAEGNAPEDRLFALGQKISLLGSSIVDNVKNFVYGKTYCQKGDTYTIDGVELTPAELGVSYSYENTGDPVYAEIMETFKKAEKAKKDREAFLKTLKEPLNFVDNDGVGHTIQPPVKKATLGYKSKIQ